jgi:hypothetical protein
VAISKEIFHQGTVHSGHTSMMDGETVGQQVLQLKVLGDEKNVCNVPFF